MNNKSEGREDGGGVCVEGCGDVWGESVCVRGVGVIYEASAKTTTIWYAPVLQQIHLTAREEIYK